MQNYLELSFNSISNISYRLGYRALDPKFCPKPAPHLCFNGINVGQLFQLYHLPKICVVIHFSFKLVKQLKLTIHQGVFYLFLPRKRANFHSWRKNILQNIIPMNSCGKTLAYNISLSYVGILSRTILSARWSKMSARTFLRGLMICCTPSFFHRCP